MLQKLEEKDGESFQMKETHSSLQEEVDNKTKKLKKVRTKTIQGGCWGCGIFHRDNITLLLCPSDLWETATSQGRAHRRSGGIYCRTSTP